ncbi:MAG: potassium transporter KefC [Methylococcaceae bacterium]|nr:potassium transporter KefC [Methylococcaceae bacterium]
MMVTYLSDIIILLIAAVIAVPIFQTLKLGAVSGFLVAGVIVGSSVLGLIDKPEEIAHLSEIGVVLLLFVIGIELKPSRLWLMRRFVFGLGSLQLLVTGAVLTGLAYYAGASLRAAILIGPALALSSTAFVLQLLTERKALNSSYGRTAFAILLLQDLAVVPLLALIPLLSMPELSIGKDIGIALAESLFILTVVILGGRYFLNPILHRVAMSDSPEVFTASAVLIVLGTALITERIGLSMALGSFIAGLLISDSSYRHQIMAEIQPFRGLLLGLFFMSMGMSLNLNYFFDNPEITLILLATLIIFKVGLLWPLAYLFGLKGKTALAVALVLGQSGEFAMVLFALANESGLLSENVFQQLLLVVLLSMLVTPALAMFSQLLLQSHVKGKDTIENIEAMIQAPIVIAGFGRVGNRIGDVLSIIGQSFVALDLDADRVEMERANGHPVFYGDVRQPEVLRAAGASEAKIMIITINDMQATEQLLISLRETRPDMSIFVRGHDLNQCRYLKELGATVAISENIEASLELARVALKEIGVKEIDQRLVLDNFRRSYHAQINEVKKDNS